MKFQTERTIKIKFEVDKNPPLNFNTEYKLLMLPYSFMTSCFTLPGLYAGKMHALLFRNWKNRIKGRDWYDFEWYIKKECSVDFIHLKERSLQSGYHGHEYFSKDKFLEMLKVKIENTDFNKAKADVSPFIKNPGSLEIWSKEYFLQLADMIKLE